MGRSKVQDEGEIIRWFAEGRTMLWMVEAYRRQYNIECGTTMFSNFRARRGLDNRAVWDTHLIPWSVREEHQQAWAVRMLRAEARSRAGFVLTPKTSSELAGWLRERERTSTVVIYDPESGFGYARRGEADVDLVRAPEDRAAFRASRRRGTTNVERSGPASPS